MKKLIILLSFLPLLSWGQPSTTGSKFVWIGGYEIIGSDTLMLDSLTGQGDPSYVLTYCADQLNNINSGYISAKSDCQINGWNVNEIFQDSAFANISFYKMDNRTLDIYNKEVLPYRLTRIVHFTSAITGATLTAYNNYFGVPFQITAAMETVCASGCDHTTIAAALTAATSGDTVVIYPGTYATANSTNKGLTIIGVGPVIWQPVTGVPIYFTGGTNHLRNLHIISNDGFGVRATIAAPVYTTIKNCLIQGTSNIYNISDDNDSITIENCRIKGYLNNYGKIFSRGNYYLTSTYAFRFRGDLKSYYDTIATQTTAGLIEELLMDSITFYNTYYNGLLFNPTLNDTLYIKIEKSKINSSIFYSRSTKNGILTLIIDSTEFIRSTYSTSFFIQKLGDGNVTLTDCYSTNFKGALIKSQKDTLRAPQYYFNIDNCNFQNNDTTLKIDIINHSVDFENSTLKNVGLFISNEDTTRHLLIDNLTYSATDSVGITLTSGVTTIQNSSFDFDTSMFFSITTNFPSDSILTISNNSFDLNTSRSITFLVLNATSSVKKYSSILMSGNKFLMPNYYGHGQNVHLFLNYGTSMTFRYNQVYGAVIGAVTKDLYSTGITNILHGNLFVDCYVPIYLRTMPNSKIYNNTFANFTKNLSYILWLDDQDGAGVNSDSCEFKNNIVYSTTGNYIYFGEGADSVGFDASNNNVYNDLSVFVGASESTFTAWQGLGYDVNSYNTDPQFASSTQLWPIGSSLAINHGYNLGSPYNIGLLPGTTWPNPTTKTQLTGYWTIGAYIVRNPILQARRSGSKWFILMNNGNIYR